MGGICGAALLAYWWWTMRKPRPVGDDELRRLRRIAESIHREQVQPFD
jgi:hypothetical protein